MSRLSRLSRFTTVFTTARALPHCIAGLGLLCATAAFAAPSGYRIASIEKSNGIKTKFANAISDNGNITGCGREAHTGADANYLMKAGGKPVSLSGPKGYCGFEGAVNDAGDVLGKYARDQGNIGTVQSALWSHDGTMIDLEVLAGCDKPLSHGYSSLGAINQAGDVAFSVNCKMNGDTVRRAVLWRQGKVTFLAKAGGQEPRANGMNKLAQVAGTVDDQAVVWQPDGSARKLGTLGGSSSFAKAINDAGHVVGDSALASGERRGFVFDGQAMKELPICGGKFSPYPVGISNEGVIVAGYGHQRRHHVALIQDGECFALDELLDSSGADWTDLYATSMNNAGVIIGTGTYQGAERSFIATPVTH